MSFTSTKVPCASLESHAGSIQAALCVLGDKWSALLLGQLVEGAKTFGELEVALGGISPRTLSQRLSKLEDDKIIAKRLYNEHPPRYTYDLTDKGRELQEVLIKMADWGAKYPQ